MKLANVQAVRVRQGQLLPAEEASPVEAKLKVLDGPPVPVEKDYAEEVAKALAGKK